MWIMTAGRMMGVSKIHQSRAERSRTPSKVKGPIRCHKCQLTCRDAEHYLSHSCKPTLSHLSRFGASSYSRLLIRASNKTSLLN
jgi:hypothetical protein